MKPTVASAILKNFLRSLPTPLLGSEMWPLMKSTIKLSEETKLKKIKAYLDKVPKSNKYLLRELFSMVDIINSNKDYTQMNYENLAVVLSPNLLWGKSKANDEMQDFLNASEFVKLIFENNQILLPEQSF
ncbi:hypothetical protein HZS_3503, partial [Henneguya salminicola]